MTSGESGGLAGQATSSVNVSEAADGALRQALDAAFAGGLPTTARVELLRRDGSRFWGRLRASPVRWDDPPAPRWFIDDVTGRASTGCIAFGNPPTIR